jgi:membrane-anchored protein YejM (alkaline phosphatase superfamily)
MKRKRKVVKVWFYPVVLALLLMQACATGGKVEKQNLVLITLDTTRSDYVDTGEGAFAFTPSLKRFAQKSAVFKRAYTPITQTLPAHLSILTGRYPHENGVFSNNYMFDHRHPMLQQVYKEKGYRTAAVVSLGTISADTGIGEGFDQYIEGLNEKDVFFATAQQVTAEGIKLLKQLKKDPFFLFLHYSDPHSPYAPPGANVSFRIELDGREFTRLNAFRGAILRARIPLSGGRHHIRFIAEADEKTFDGFVLRHLKAGKNRKVTYSNIQYSRQLYGGSHVIKGVEGSMTVSGGGPGHLALFQVIPSLTWKAAHHLYRLEVEYMDRQVGNFLSVLEKEGLMKRTAVVIVGDHGEGLGERDRYFGHVRYLNRQFIQVPLMIYLPGKKPVQVDDPVSHIHIAPTLLQYMAAKHPDFPPQHSLLDLIEPGPGAEKNKVGRKNRRGPVYSFAFNPSAIEDKLSIISWPYQCITVRGPTAESEREYYHLALSTSHRKWDMYPVQVMSKHAMPVFRLFQRSVSRMSNVFKYSHLAKINAGDAPTEKLKTIGYVH